MKGGAMLHALLPAQADNSYAGRRGALWLLGLYVALKLVMGVNSIVNTATVAAGADGIPLDSFGPAAARTVLTLFALTALGQLSLALVGLAALLRYRALVPLVFLLLVADQLARRVIVQLRDVARHEGSVAAWYINMSLLALLLIGLALSLIPRRGRGGEAA